MLSELGYNWNIIARKNASERQVFFQAVNIESPILIIKSILGVSFFGDKLGDKVRGK